MATSLSKVTVKTPCPYMIKCYRRNPIHFSEMSHPHLERIVISQLDDDIKLPERLDFECTDRSLLLDQLKVLQIVLRKEKNKNLSNSSNTDLNSKPSSTSSTVEGESSTRNEDKVIDKRDNVEISKMKDKFDDILVVASTKKCILQVKKRDRCVPHNSDREIKKSKINDSTCNKEVGECSSSTWKCSDNSSSLFKNFLLCRSAESRNEFRDKAILKMKEHGFTVSVVPPGNFAMKYALSAPYHFFSTRVQKSKATYDQSLSVTFPEILDISLGEIVCSLHINFMVDVGWLCLQYLLAGQSTSMYILYGERVDTESVGLHITMLPVDMSSKFGCHHSKIMIFKYKDESIRIIICTANLYSDDWENRTQGVWISPCLPPLPESAKPSEGESETGFKKDFGRYLQRYMQPGIAEWTCAVRRADFSAINVFFLASVPGRHTGIECDFWGHMRLGSILSKHATLPPDSPQWTLVAQSSSIGSLGPNYESWIQKDIVSSMSKENPRSLKSQPNFQFIYPSLNNYKESFDCRDGSCCFPYSLKMHSRQEWIESYMCQWKASCNHRDKAMPHIKSYTRISPDLKSIPWFVLTSANLSKAAWGTTTKDAHNILNYEAGVVFIPHFVIGKPTFPIKEEEPGIPVFPIPYDLPLTPYGREDKPFVVDIFSS